jgi:phosphohistidine phosphatase SixA
MANVTFFAHKLRRAWFLKASVASVSALWILTAPTVAAGQGAVFVVRHTERADQSADSILSAAGIARAERLSVILKGAGITQIYASNTRRALDTASPLAKALQLTPTEVPGTDYDALLSKLRAATRQDRVLIVGHSNTVPEILRRLGVTTPVTIADTEHDNLFIVIPREGSAPLFIPIKY